MGLAFHAQTGPAEALCSQLAARYPANPFFTPQFVASRRAGGAQPWIILLRAGENIVTGCTAFIASGLLSRTLEIQSLPGNLGIDFWNGLETFCRERKISDLVVNTFGSEQAVIPRLASETSRKPRREYVLHLANERVSGKLSINHKRNIAHAKKLGLVVRKSADLDACTRHAELMDASMNRRMARGEVVSSTTSVQNVWRYVESSSGAIYQALEGSTILSSVLVLFAKRGAYYYSAGTSPEGMAKGASHFLIYSIAENLAQAGFELFNLGGADDAGLGRFKSGFGTTVVELESASFFVGNPWKRKVINAARMLRDDPRGLLRLFCGIDSYVAFAVCPQDIGPLEERGEIRVEKLTDEALYEAIRSHPEMAYHARVLQLGHNDAYGVYYLGQLAHVSWLIPDEHDRQYPVRNVKLKRGEAEISHAVTFPEFRGKALHPYAIRALTAIAGAQGLRRVFGITSTGNLIAQRNIEKAGLRRVGRIWRLNLRYPQGTSITLRGHRLHVR